MQTNSTDHVRHAARWVTGVQAPTSTAASPLAFFDLIMDSAREATRSGQFEPLPKLENANRSAPATDPHLDDEEEENTPRQATAEDFQGRDLPLEVPQLTQNQPAEAHSETSDTPSDEAATAEISREAIAEVDAAAQSGVSLESGKQADDHRSSEESRLTRPESLPTTQQPTGEPVAQTNNETPLDTAEQGSAGPIDADPAPPATEGNSTDGDSSQRRPGPTGEPIIDNTQAIDERQAEQAARDVALAERRSATESQREADQKQQADLAAETGNLEPEPAETRTPRRSSPKVDPATVQDKTESPNQQAAAEQATAQATGKPPLTETPGSHQAEAARGPVPVATGVETAKAVTGVEQGGTAEGSGSDGVSSLVQRGIQRGLIKSSSTPQQSNPVDTRQQIRMVNRVARAVESTPPGQPVRIRLNPPELGALRIEIRIDKGAMTAKIEAETEVARQLLTENLPQLKERLAESNITIEKFEIELLGKETTGDGQNHSSSAEDRQAQGEGRSRQRGESTARPTGEPAEGEGTPSRGEILDRDSRNLNIVI